MYGAETCRSGINISNILFISHMHSVGFNSFQLLKKCMVQAKKKNKHVLFKLEMFDDTHNHSRFEK
jgi:hypothetical protein